MLSRNWKKDVWTIPNLLSLSRLALIPVYMRIYLRADALREFHLAGLILAISCLTDLADGFIARTFQMQSSLGKWLDPLADKATQLSLTVCLSLRHSILMPVLLLLISKEAFQLAAGLLCLRQGKMLSRGLLIGKVCTAVLFISLTVLVLMPDPPPAAVNLLALIDLAVLSLAFLGYVQAYFGSDRYLQNLE